MSDPTEAVNAAMEAEFRLHLTFDTETGAHRAHRSSLWRLTGGGCSTSTRARGAAATERRPACPGDPGSWNRAEG